MASLNAALDFLERKYGNPSQPPAGDGGMDPSAAPTPRQGAQMIDFETPLPDWQPSAGAVDMPPEQDQAMVPLQDEEPAQNYAPQRVSRVEQGDTFNAALDFLTRKYGDPQQAATQQAVAEATTPTENLPVLKSDLANALGVLDYRDPEEGQRRQQATAMGEILGLPEYEKVQLGAAPVNADGTVTIRRAQAVSPEANAAAAKQLANMQTMAAGEMLVEESPKEVGSLQGIANAAQNAFDSARQALMATDGLDENDASQIARIEYNKAARRVAPGYAAYQQAEGWEAVKAFAKNPFEVTANIITEGLAGSWPALAGGLATGGATALAVGAAGSVVPGVGNVIGAGGGFTAGMVGGTAAGSFATEYGSKILEELQTAGMNPKNPESIAKFFSNETLMAEAKDAAFKRGVPVAAFDALSAGIAGRVGSVFRAAAKTPVRLAVTEGVIQGGLGGAGEVAGSVAAGDPVNPKAVFGEVLGEVGPAAIEIAAGRQAAAPAEVPQNFTPISSPAPSAPTGQAPRTLGQVRAPEIPIDQTALDEAFGSTFAPPAAVNPQVNPAPAPVADIPPTASAPVASTLTAPEITGSPELIAGEGAAFSFTTNGITPEQQARTDFFAGAINQQLRTQGILTPDQSLALQPVALDRVDAGAGFADFLEGFQSITGTTVQFVKPSDPTIFGGAVRSDDARTIFINAESQRPALALIGHEWGHTIQNTDPALYKELRRVVARYTDNYRTRAREAGASPLYQGTRAKTAELTNNTLGDAFLDPEFWNSLRAEDQPMAKRLWENLTNWFNEILARSKGTAWGTEQFATDLSAMRRDLARVIAPSLKDSQNLDAVEQNIIRFAAEPAKIGNILDALPRRGAIVKKKAEVKEDGTVYYNGKEPSQWSPEDFKAYGQEFGVRNLGPLSKISNIVDELGRPVAQIPGGLDGKFTYYDLLHLKANAVDVRKLPVELHGQLTAKLARTMTPERGNDVQKFNGILFGMLSPNSPLLPNEFGQARMRFSTMEEIKRFADLLPDNPTKEQRLSVNKRLKNELGFTEAKSGGLGIGISVDLSNIVMASKLFVKNPDFFIKKPKESWANFVDKLTTQVSGLGTKTASFGGVWQDPLNAGISAMDRHMARAFSDELINNPDIRGRFEGIVVNRFNNLLDISKATVKTADAKIRKAKTDKAKAKAEQDKAAAMQNLPDPSALKADTLDDVLGQAEIFGADRIKDFVNEAVFAAMGSRKNKYLMKGGQVNPNLPESIQGVEWVKTPKDFQVMSEAYRLALDINAERAKSIGIEIFPAQWTLWDRIRGRVEPHEAMFPGLEKLPALNDRQLSEAFTANKRAGYASTPNPGQAWKRQEGIPAASLAYFAAEPKPRKFGQSLQAAPGVAPEVKSRLTSLDYDPVSNAETLANARARIDSAGSIDTAFTDLMGKPAIEGWQPTAEDYATGMELMAQLQNRNRHADAASIANMMATRATDQGRAIQALSMIGRLGPQGIELFAQSQLQAAATKPAKTDKQKANIQAKITEAGQFQGEIDKLRRNNTTAAIVANKDLIKSELPAGVDAVQVNIAIREAILGAPTPLAAQAATSSILTSQGLSDKGAARISGSIVRDFLKTTQDTRATVLQDLLATADSDRRLDKSKLGSLIRLNREGKLTDASLHAGMAKMLGIPHWSAEHSAKVRRILAQHEKATDPRIKLVKAAEALDVVYRDFMPPGFLDKVDTIQTIAMLLNTKTVGRNVIGNTLMATADLAADAVSVPMDALVSLGTGERTRTGLSLGERMMGLGAGVGDIKAGYDFARSEGRGRIGSIAEGVDTLVRLGRLQSSGKYNASDISALSGPTFTAPGFRHLESTLGLVLSITDRGFYESAFRASLDTRMKAAAANGNPMLAPDPDMVTAARMDAGRAIYQDDNAASRTLSDLRRALNRNKRWGIGSLLMKFTQVPGSILTRAVEFSPLGFINTAYQSLAPMLSNSREFDQKAFTDSFSRALVGTTGLVATGYWLAHLGIISAGGDAKDEDKRNLNRAMGWGTYKLNVDALKRALMTGNFWTPQKQQRDDKVINYDWAQPLSIGVAMGAYSRENQEAIKQDILQGKKQSLAATGLNWLAYAGGAATGAMNSLVEQPLLTGLNQFARDVGYDNIPGALLKTAADAPGTFIPTAARQWMQLTDNAVRETRDSSPARQFINELKAQLPGQSQTLPPKYDITGQPVERWAKDSNTLFNVLFNPSMVSYIKGSPALTEMSKVYKYTAETGAVPNPVKPEFKLDGVTVRLTSEEISAMQKDMGALSIAALEKFVLSDPRYDKATWDIKAKAMTRALEKAATAAKYRILLARPDLKTRAKQEYEAAIAADAATQAEMVAADGP